jgi:membrane-bound lytic murein transglycosylase F
LQNEVSPLHLPTGRQLKRYAYAILAALVSLPILYSGHDEPTRLQQAYQRGSLTLLTRNGPSSYFIDSERKAGPEYDIVAAFAGYLGLAIKVKVANEFGNLESLLKNRQGELIAANLTRTRAREKLFTFGPD